MSLIEWIGWATVALDALIAVMALRIVVLVRPTLNYWPALSVLSVLTGFRALYTAIAYFPWGDGVTGAMVHPLPILFLQGLIFGGCIWVRWLVHKQNQVSDRGSVDLDGVVHPVTPDQARKRVDHAVRRAQESGAAPVPRKEHPHAP